MTNTELLKVPKTLLGELERQACYVLQRACDPMACPHCLKPCSQVEATGKTLDEYPVNGRDPDFACPHCHTELEFCVPFIGACFWRRLHPGEPVNSGV